MDDDADAKFVGKTLQFAFPQLDAIAVTATAVAGDRQAFGVGIAHAANVLPPAPHRLYREGRRVMVHPDTDPACIGGDIVNAIRHRATERFAEKVIHPDFFWLALRPPLPPG